MAQKIADTVLAKFPELLAGGQPAYEGKALLQQLKMLKLKPREERSTKLGNLHRLDVRPRWGWCHLAHALLHAGPWPPPVRVRVARGSRRSPPSPHHTGEPLMPFGLHADKDVLWPAVLLTITPDRIQSIQPIRRRRAHTPSLHPPKQTPTNHSLHDDVGTHA